MDPIDTVSARLDAALTRLENAIDTLIAKQRQASGDPAMAAQLAELGVERDKLRAALDSTQRQYEDLRSVSEAASSRLDETIGHVRILLEDGDGPSHGSH